MKLKLLEIGRLEKGRAMVMLNFLKRKVVLILVIMDLKKLNFKGELLRLKMLKKDILKIISIQFKILNFKNKTNFKRQTKKKEN